jgi:small subunit ribosomal protein S4
MASGEKLVELLERRLDNVVFRAGFANTIPAARQLINHRHLRVNGRRVDIASFRVKAGDIIEFRPKSQKLDSVTEALQSGGQYRAEWMQVDTTRRLVTITELPTVETLLFPLDLQFVIEYYSRLL